jgi:(p)ppGpp synthase/HD superfamily hydrolase
MEWSFLCLAAIKIEDMIISSCWKPHLGDNFVGILESENIVHVHSKLCENVDNLLSMDYTKSIFISWDRINVKEYELEVLLENTSGKLLNLIDKLYKLDCNITHIDLNKLCTIKNKEYCSIKFSSRKMMEELAKNLKTEYYIIESLKSLNI